MTQKNTKKREVFLAVDCEFSKDGKVREITLLLFRGTRLLRALEIYVSKSGNIKTVYATDSVSYHIQKYSDIRPLVNAFLTSCQTFCPIEKIRLVGIGVYQDIKLVHKTVGGGTLLNSLKATTDLEFCGRGRLKDKVQDHNITAEQLSLFLSRIVGKKNVSHFNYHTSMYDSIATAYVYCRLTNPKCMLTIDPLFKQSKYTYFKNYYIDLQEIKALSKKEALDQKTSEVRIPKNFPEVRYKVQKNISNVFDIVPRQLFFEKYSSYNREPSISEIYAVKQEIAKKCYLIKQSLKVYDHDAMRTNPYNIPLVEAGVWLAKGKITIETFIDFAIYIQQYNLPPSKGKYYKVGSSKKEIYLRCLDPLTAKKIFNQKPYCTIEQFIKKPIPTCRIEEIL